MKKMNDILAFVASLLLVGCTTSENEKLGQYVDPNIGGVAPLLTTVTPQVHRPNSMVRIFPVTKAALGDRYLSDKIYSVGLNMVQYREGVVTSIMPTSGKLQTNIDSCASWYDHDVEVLHPWLHQVYLDDHGITAKWSTTERTSIFSFAFEEADKKQSNVIFRIRKGGKIEIKDNYIVCGYENVNYAKQYFYAISDTPFAKAGVWDETGIKDSKIQEGQHVGAWVQSNGKEVTFRIGVSYISIEQAKANLEKENLVKSFAEIVSESEAIWENVLGKIRVEGGTEREKRIFYTSLYRNYERMVNQSEGEQYYSGFDRQVHTDQRPFYNDDWNWDTYRNSHALQTILDPKQKADHLQSYVRMYEQSGWVPNFPELTERRKIVRDLIEEPMIGNHAASILAEALIKGVEDFDVEKAYEGVRKNAFEGTMIPWRLGSATELDKFYFEKGYFPGLFPGQPEVYDYIDDSWEKRQSVSVTLEHSYDDWCLAQVAKRLGKTQDYEILMKRSQNYMNLWNPETKYFAPKGENGEWITPFDPEVSGEGYGARSYFAEVNACVHLFHVQHDVPNLVKIMGGKTAFVDRLDEMYNKAPQMGKWRFMGRMPDATGLQGMIPAGNEPAFHIPYLYNYADAAWKTQHRVRQVCDIWFDDSPSGLSGDEDGGALTAWYVFSAMGFYPVNPASGEYAITSPIFSNIEITLPDGKTFSIKSNATKKNKYIQSATLNGKPLNVPFITHAEIMSGGVLEFALDDKPNKDWGKQN